MVAARIREHEALERRDGRFDAERGDAAEPPEVSPCSNRAPRRVGRVEVVEQVVLQEQAGRRLGPGLELGVGWGWGQGLGPRLQVTCAS